MYLWVFLAPAGGVWDHGVCGINATHFHHKLRMSLGNCVANLLKSVVENGTYGTGRQTF